ncbi:hypothetical protein FALBO_2964 [Fusarium albosuccineum]|uniref:Uncharacterized protein n=1 Tax=Fusarium albosuccineum TaxID=1237068 RepID=A0A8H4LL26_9HYPO|nr:hypothetical protein FALBO_2964 [Fusarium albosuccineum]
MDPPRTPARRNPAHRRSASAQQNLSAHSSRSPRANPSAAKSGVNLVENLYYHSAHLSDNNIIYRYRDEPFPVHVRELIDRIQRPRDSPVPHNENCPNLREEQMRQMLRSTSSIPWFQNFHSTMP